MLIIFGGLRARIFLDNYLLMLELMLYLACPWIFYRVKVNITTWVCSVLYEYIQWIYQLFVYFVWLL